MKPWLFRSSHYMRELNSLPTNFPPKGCANVAIQCTKSLKPGQYFGAKNGKFYWYLGVRWEDRLSHPSKLSNRLVWVLWHSLQCRLIADTIWMKHGLWLLQSLYVLLAGDALEDVEAITRYLTTYWYNLNASPTFLTVSVKTEPYWAIKKETLTRFCRAH